MARTSFTLVVLGIAGGMALALGLIGIYGVIAFAVSQRTREIGIRLALGAQSREVRNMFVRHGLGLCAIGIVIGVGARGWSHTFDEGGAVRSRPNRSADFRRCSPCPARGSSRGLLHTSTQGVDGRSCRGHADGVRGMVRSLNGEGASVGLLRHQA